MPVTLFVSGSEDGLTKLAEDVVVWCGHPDIAVTVSVELGMTENWKYQIKQQTLRITVSDELAQHRPFLAAYTVIKLVLATIVQRYGHLGRHASSQPGLIEHFTIEAGFGLYGLNAAQELDLWRLLRQPSPAFSELTPDYYQQQFLAWCAGHRIVLHQYRQYVLPKVIQQLHLDPHVKSYDHGVAMYVDHWRQKKETIILLVLATISMGLLMWVLWPHVPRALTAEQRTMSQEITSLRSDYARCTVTFRETLQIPYHPDILSSQTLQRQAKQCYQIKQQHDQLVRDFNASLR